MLIIEIKWVFILGLVVFLCGTTGLILNRRNIIMLILSLELLLLAINLNFTILSLWLFDMVGQIFVVFVLTVAAAESSIGLAILIAQFRLSGNIQLKNDSNILLPTNYIV